MSAQDESRKLARKILSAFLGIDLPDFAIVHHLDGNPLNNSIHNLKIVTRAEHAVIHSGKDQRKNRSSTRGRDLPKGISWDINRYHYKASIRVGPKRYQSAHKTLEDAIQWRLAMESIYWGDE